MFELDIQRSRGDQEVSSKSWQAIREFEAAAAQFFFERFEEGEFQGIGGLQLVDRSDVPEGLLQHFGPEAKRFLIKVGYSDIEHKTLTTVFDLDERQGMQHQVYENPDIEDELYDMEERWLNNFGTLWVPELLEPGSHPEFSEFAELARRDFFDPSQLTTVSTGSETGTEGPLPIALLDRLQFVQFDQVIKLYSRIAYPHDPTRDVVGSSLDHYFEVVKSGSNVGIRAGTQHLGCAKHEVSGDVRENTFITYMYLNYEIGIRGVKFYFNDDLQMANDFRAGAQDLFVRQGIAKEGAD